MIHPLLIYTCMCTRGPGTLTFWTEGRRYRTATFQDEKVKNLLSPAVNRGDLRRLNYYQTVFGRGSAHDRAGWAHDALSDPRVGDTFSAFSSPLASGPKGASFSFWIGTPPLFRPKLRPWVHHVKVKVKSRDYQRTDRYSTVRLNLTMRPTPRLNRSDSACSLDAMFVVSDNNCQLPYIYTVTKYNRISHLWHA